jgi:2-amino-4-hydroxy-6-hydroxymethyldihydropteridine diphosphokinase
MNKAYLSLGGNVGDRKKMLNDGLRLIGEQCGQVGKKSAIYETAAWGKTDQSPFLNIALELTTNLQAGELLHEVRAIETALGRQREIKWGPRTLDIDILLFNDEIIDSPDLTVPHPYMHTRRFVLEPLAEIAPELLHPVFHKTVADLLAKCLDTLAINKHINF